MEPKCEEVCPEGYYGLQCVEPCNCNRKGNFVCHPVSGCVCKAGFAGSNCDLRIVEGQVQEPPGKIVNIYYEFLIFITIAKYICGYDFVVHIFFHNNFNPRIHNKKSQTYFELKIHQKCYL